jgi:hypothetical protein
VFDDDGHDSVTAPPPFDAADLADTGTGTASEYGEEGRGRGQGYRETTGRSRKPSPAQHNHRDQYRDPNHSSQHRQPARSGNSGKRVTSYGQFEEDFTSGDAAWATEVLMRQSRLEQRLGRSYF